MGNNEVNVFFYTGPDFDFKKQFTSEYTSFSELMNMYEYYHNLKNIAIEGNVIQVEVEKIAKVYISSSEYLGFNHHVFERIIYYFDYFSVEDVWIQNASRTLKKSLVDGQKFKIENIDYKYENYIFDLESIKNFDKMHDFNILGQKVAINSLKQYMITKLFDNNAKPLVLLFYGPPGVGKTELAKKIAVFFSNSNIFRIQFSMYQSTSMFDFLFGGETVKESLSHRMLKRDSNVILFDEFDKVDNRFYNAFYQLFDEGELNDNHYNVDMRNSIIICTSNFLNTNEAYEKLGTPIADRMDGMIQFEELDMESCIKIMHTSIREYESNFVEYEKLEEFKEGIKLIIQKHNINNYRQIDNLVRKYLSKEILEGNVTLKQ